MSKEEHEQQAPAPATTAAESESEEEQAPLHDVTATTVSGARVRRSTQMFTVAAPKEDDTDAFTPPRGSGPQLRDIAGAGDAVAALGKKHAETLKALYAVMYARRFQLKNLKAIKEHILAFSGIPEAEQDAKARETLFGKIARWKRSFVQEVMDVLGVDRSKKSFDDAEKLFDKDALINRLVDWLYSPQEKKGSGRKASPKAAAKKPTKAEKAAVKPPAKRKSTAKDTAAKKKQKTAAGKRKSVADGDDDDDDDGEEEEEEVGSEDEAEGESDYAEDEKKPAKKAAAKRSGRAVKKAKAKVAEEDDEDDGEKEDVDNDEKEDGENDEKEDGDASPEQKSGDDAAALDADVQAKVKQIIEQGNAEELTVKKIVRQVSEELGRDLSAEKNAIKEFIKAGQ